MKAGLLSQRVSIQSNTHTVSSTGDRVDTWATRSTCWADIRALRGREYYLAQQVNSEVQLKVTIWYDASVVTTDRIVWGSRTLEVIAPPIDIGNQKKQLELLCREING